MANTVVLPTQGEFHTVAANSFVNVVVVGVEVTELMDHARGHVGIAKHC